MREADAGMTQIAMQGNQGRFHNDQTVYAEFFYHAKRNDAKSLEEGREIFEDVPYVKIMVPEQFMGDVTGDLNHKRGRILGMGAEHGMQVMNAEVPQAELENYESRLKSITGGEGHYQIEFSHYARVPGNVQKELAASFTVEDVES